MRPPALQVALSDPRLLVPIGGAAVALLLSLASTLSFHGDEWAFIVDRDLTVDGLLRPHNEHLAALHVVVYRVLIGVFGTGSYLPFLATLLVAHLIAAAGLYRVLAQDMPPLATNACVTLFLVLGSGFDNLVWAFQIGFVGSMAFGLWSLAVASRPGVAALLLTAAIWTSSVGLLFVLPVGVLIARRSVLVVPLATYAVWLAVFGRRTVEAATIDQLIAYAVTAVGSAFAGVSGLSVGTVEPADAGLGIAAGCVVALGLTVQAARVGVPRRVVLAGLLGLASEIALLTLARAHFGAEQAAAPRYIYAAAPFILMLLPGLPSLPRVAWPALFVVAMTSNLLALPRGVAIYHAFVAFDRSQTMEERLAPYRESAPP